MKTLKLLVAAAILSGTIMATPSCGKYEEGPEFTLLTKKARVAGDWDVKEYVDENGNVTIDNSDDYVTFEKDGTYKTTIDNSTFVGTWEFTSKKENLRASYTVGNFEFTTERPILRLTNDELWLKDEEYNRTIKLEAR